MKKHHVHTTLSPKHWELLKKMTDKFGSQQKALELSLEALSNWGKESGPLSDEEKCWLGFADQKSACVIQKDGLKQLINTLDIVAFRDYVAREKPLEYFLMYYYHKPITEMNLKDIMEGLIITTRIGHWFDLVEYTDDGDYYTLKIYHSLGLNNSKMQSVLYKSVFDTYGARSESTISEKAFFMKIYKNPDNESMDHD